MNGLEDSVINLQGQAESLSAENNDLKSELEAATAKYNAIESEQKECMHKLDEGCHWRQRSRSPEKSEEMARVCSVMEVSTSQMLAQQNQMEYIKEKLDLCISGKDSFSRKLKGTHEVLSSLSKEKQMKAEEQVAQVLSQQKETESIENQVNSSVLDKDTLLREFGNTALLKELEKTKVTLSSPKKSTPKQNAVGCIALSTEVNIIDWISWIRVYLIRLSC